MIKNNFKSKYSIYITCFLIISSFLPIVYFLSLGINGFIIYLLQKITNIDENKISLFINPILSIIFAFLYYQSNNFIKQLLNSIGLIICVISFIYTIKLKIYGNEDGDFYFLPFLISSLIIGVIIISIDSFKIKQHIT